MTVIIFKEIRLLRGVQKWLVSRDISVLMVDEIFVRQGRLPVFLGRFDLSVQDYVSRDIIV
jgi:hypothetical protein